MNTRMKQRGLTLIELMLAMTLGLLLLIGIASLFLQSNRSSRQNDLIAGMQDQGRFALATLSRDLMMAGYWGGIYSASGVSVDAALATALPPTADCGPDTSTSWAFRTSPNPPLPRLEFRNQNSATTVAATWRCIGNPLSGTDMVSIRHVSGNPTGAMLSSDTSVTLRPHHYYLQTNGTIGTLMRWGSASYAAPGSVNSPLTPPMSFYKYVPSIYFVRDHAHTVGDGVPALCRKLLCPSGYAAGSGSESASCVGSGSATGIYSECIADGVEDMQVIWGLDTDIDGVPDRYTSTPSATEMASKVVVAQISLLLRSRQTDGSYTDKKTYLLGDKTGYSPNDHYYRRVFSTTVQLRNPVN